MIPKRRPARCKTPTACAPKLELGSEGKRLLATLCAAALFLAVPVAPSGHAEPRPADKIPALVTALADADPAVRETAGAKLSAAGLPAVAYSVAGVREAIVEGETGFLITPGDAAGWRARLATLANDPELRARLGAAARARARRRFSLAGMLAETLALYRELLSRPAGG